MALDRRGHISATQPSLIRCSVTPVRNASCQLREKAQHGRHVGPHGLALGARRAVACRVLEVAEELASRSTGSKLIRGIGS